MDRKGGIGKKSVTGNMIAMEMAQADVINPAGQFLQAFSGPRIDENPPLPLKVERMGKGKTAFVFTVNDPDAWPYFFHIYSQPFQFMFLRRVSRSEALQG